VRNTCTDTTKDCTATILIADIESPETMSTDEPLFRPAKRRKFYRKRNEENDGENIASPVPLITQASLTRPPLTEADHEDEVSEEAASDIEDSTRFAIAEILRRRKAARNRRGGIEFTNSTISSMSVSATPQPSGALSEKDESPREVQTVVNRFAPQTGQVADVDKHM